MQASEERSHDGGEDRGDCFMLNKMMNCRDITRSVTDFLEHRLRLRDRLGFLLHIAMCGGCRTYLAQIRASIAAMHALSVPRPAGPPVEALLERFREETGRPDR